MRECLCRPSGGAGAHGQAEAARRAPLRAGRGALSVTALSAAGQGWMQLMVLSAQPCACSAKGIFKRILMC